MLIVYTFKSVVLALQLTLGINYPVAMFWYPIPRLAAGA